MLELNIQKPNFSNTKTDEPRKEIPYRGCAARCGTFPSAVRFAAPAIRRTCTGDGAAHNYDTSRIRT